MNLQELIGVLQRQDVSDSDEEFADKIRAAGEFLSEQTMSTVCTVSIQTVQRWKQGRTTPLRLIMKTVYLQLTRELLKLAVEEN